MAAVWPTRRNKMLTTTMSHHCQRFKVDEEAAGACCLMTAASFGSCMGRCSPWTRRDALTKISTQSFESTHAVKFQSLFQIVMSILGIYFTPIFARASILLQFLPLSNLKHFDPHVYIYIFINTEIYFSLGQTSNPTLHSSSFFSYINCFFALPISIRANIIKAHQKKKKKTKDTIVQISLTPIISIDCTLSTRNFRGQ